MATPATDEVPEVAAGEEPREAEQQQQSPRSEGATPAFKSPRSGTKPLEQAQEPDSAAMPEDNNSEEAQEDNLATGTSSNMMGARRSMMGARASIVAKRTSVVAQEAALQGTAFAIHWFGARRFHHEDVLERNERERVIRRQSTRAKDMIRELKNENFKVQRRTKGGGVDRLSSMRTQKSERTTPPSSPRLDKEGQDKVGLKTSPGETAQGGSGGLSDMLGEVGDVLEKGTDFVLDARTSGLFTEEDLQTQSRPWFIIFQVLLCFLLWIIFTFVDSSSLAGLDSIFPGKTMLFMHEDCNDFRPEVWRWYTYQFTHVAAGHIITNCFIALVAGMPLEGFHGLLRTAAIFNIGVLGGAANHLIVMPHQSGLAGMSAGCYSLLGMHWGDLMMNWRQSKYRRGKLILLVFLILVDILANTVLAPEKEPGQPSVSHSSHLGGFVAGLLAGILLVRNLKVTRGERIVQAVAVFFWVFGIIFIICWLAQWPPKGLFDPLGWCWLRQANNNTVFGDLNWHCIMCSDQPCISGWAAEQSINPIAQETCTQLDRWN